MCPSPLCGIKSAEGCNRKASLCSERLRTATSHVQVSIVFNDDGRQLVDSNWPLTENGTTLPATPLIGVGQRVKGNHDSRRLGRLCHFIKLSGASISTDWSPSIPQEAEWSWLSSDLIAVIAHHALEPVRQKQSWPILLRVKERATRSR